MTRRAAGQRGGQSAREGWHRLPAPGATFPRRVSIHGTDRGSGNVVLKGAARDRAAAWRCGEVTLGDGMDVKRNYWVLGGGGERRYRCRIGTSAARRQPVQPDDAVSRRNTIPDVTAHTDRVSSCDP